MKKLTILFALLAAGAALASPESQLLAHIRVLASDEFEGRAPGGVGEAKTIAYIEQQLRAIGVGPGNPDGSYLQQVPMVGLTSTPSLSLDVGGKPIAMQVLDDFVAFAHETKEQVRIDRSELVFVGYGVQSPENGWDDYKGVDVRGKTIVMLINDPQVTDASGKLDPKVFRGKAMTYYGRWTYKYEIAAKLGAAAALIVHETGPAGYPFEVVRNSWGHERFQLRDPGPAPEFPTVAGWITSEKAQAIAAAGGLDFAQLKKAALSKDFKPVALHGTASFNVRNQWRELVSHNVVGRIAGSGDETVVYSAHWDHLGKSGNQIFHGALDNASGVASVLEIARAFKAAPAGKRSILFLLPTAEEQGLLGTRYYASHPLYPITHTVANINIDGINAWGRTEQVEHVTSGHSTLDELLEAQAQAQGRRVEPDTRSELGYFYRADQLEFARAGVPVLYLKRGSSFVGKPPGYGRARVDAYTKDDYHKVSDSLRDDWDLAGAIEDNALLFRVGQALAAGAPAPKWKAGSEFHR